MTVLSTAPPNCHHWKYFLFETHFIFACHPYRPAWFLSLFICPLQTVDGNKNIWPHCWEQHVHPFAVNDLWTTKFFLTPYDFQTGNRKNCRPKILLSEEVSYSIPSKVLHLFSALVWILPSMQKYNLLKSLKWLIMIGPLLHHQSVHCHLW